MRRRGHACVLVEPKGAAQRRQLVVEVGTALRWRRHAAGVLCGDVHGGGSHGIWHSSGMWLSRPPAPATCTRAPPTAPRPHSRWQRRCQAPRRRGLGTAAPSRSGSLRGGKIACSFRRQHGGAARHCGSGAVLLQTAAARHLRVPSPFHANTRTIVAAHQRDDLAIAVDEHPAAVVTRAGRRSRARSWAVVLHGLLRLLWLLLLWLLLLRLHLPVVFVCPPNMCAWRARVSASTWQLAAG